MNGEFSDQKQVKNSSNAEAEYSAGRGYRWKKMRNSDIKQAETLLCEIENDYVSACAKFLARKDSKEPVWLLRKKKRESSSRDIAALIINSKSNIIPALRGLQEIPEFKFLKSFLRFNKIHSVQGLKNEVIILENEIKKTGCKPADIIDYELMNLDRPPDTSLTNDSFSVNPGRAAGTENKNLPGSLILCVPRMTDLDAIAPLQAAYEQEEVIPSGSVFSPAASRINTARIIANGSILAAKLNGRFIAKINVSAVSFTRYQIGGVYVHPGFRGLGIAGRMASVFISSLIEEGRGVTLFVKKNNTAARRLYLKMGFTIRNDYRITYY